MKPLPRILLTAGEPAGVGPDLIVKIAQQEWPAELVVIGDRDLLLERAKSHNLELHLNPFSFTETPTASPTSTLKIIPVNLQKPVTAGVLDKANSAYVLETLSIAADHCFQKFADAIVTTPVNKAIINEAGYKFFGHTEFFAAQWDIKRTVMLFVINQLRVALVTTHVALNQVSQTITKELLRETIEILQKDLKDKFKIENPHILVCGLNPHAGENGYLGREEIDTIKPVLEELRQEGYQLEGPLPADTIFTPKYLAKADAILAMYHDQALPVVKQMGFGEAVNVTLGLPFIRTSVDHGTALDIAGTNAVDDSSMFSALKLALKLTR